MFAAARLVDHRGGHFLTRPALTGNNHRAVAVADDTDETNTARIRALRPTTTESIAKDEVLIGVTSQDAQRFEAGNLIPKGRLDTDVESHVRARTPDAHAGEAYGSRPLVHLD